MLARFARSRRASRPARWSLPSRRAAVRAAGIFVIAGVLAGTLVAVVRQPAGTHITAYFRETVSVFRSSDVRILGVKVGSVDSVRPEGTYVKVTMTVDSGIAVPANAAAVVIAPSVIADRYVQLTPAYTGGPKLASGAVIPLSRTATPVELDQLYASLTRLATDLGPRGGNAHGALNDVINTGAANLAGNGKALGTLIDRFGQLMRTLNGTSSDFFGTVSNLEQFTAMLKTNDGQVRLANQQLAQVLGVLAADRQSLGAALSELATALAQVKSFVAGNRSRIQSNVTKLESLTRLLVNERASLAEAFDDAPLAADNFLSIYDPAFRILDGRGDLNDISMGPCSYFANPYQTGCPTAFGPAGQTAGGVSQAAAPPLPLPAAGPVFSTSGTSGAAGNAGGSGTGGR